MYERAGKTHKDRIMVSQGEKEGSSGSFFNYHILVSWACNMQKLLESACRVQLSSVHFDLYFSLLHIRILLVTFLIFCIKRTCLFTFYILELQSYWYSYLVVTPCLRALLWIVLHTKQYIVSVPTRRENKIGINLGRMAFFDR